MSESENKDAGKDNAGVIFPPPLIYLGFLVTGLVIDYFIPLPLLTNTMQVTLGSLFVVCALAANLPALFLMKKAGTAINPSKATTALMTSGPFRFTRNPLYVGLSLLYVGIAVLADSIWVLLLLLPLLLIMILGVILREERYLEGKFGEEYLRYKASVRRWF